MERKTSKIWALFRPVDDTYALCNICKAKLSYKTTTTNLSKHLLRKHPSYSYSLPRQRLRYQLLSKKIHTHRAKPKNPSQEKCLVEFIKKHPIILLQTPTKENRNKFEELWKRLASELNQLGPPQKDVTTWKRALKDWKIHLRKKIEKSHIENGPNGAQILTPAEVTLAQMWGIDDELGHFITYASSDDDMQQISNARDCKLNAEDFEVKEEAEESQVRSSCEPQEYKKETSTDPLFIDDHGKPKQVPNLNVDTAEKLCKKLSFVDETVTRTISVLHDFCSLYEQKLTEDKRHHVAIEKLMADKLELKKKLLKIEQEKLLLK